MAFLVEVVDVELMIGLESPIERTMFHLLLDAPGMNLSAGFAVCENVDDAFRTLRDRPGDFSRRRFVVFPQAKHGSYRVDFLCAVTDRYFDRASINDGFEFFIIECDGEEYHGLESGRISADREREKALKDSLGFPVLRFSGAELIYRSGSVHTVLSAYVKAIILRREWARATGAMRHLEHGSAGRVLHAIPDLAAIDTVLSRVEKMTCMPWMRHGYQTAPGEAEVFRLERAVEHMDDWAAEYGAVDELEMQE